MIQLRTPNYIIEL